MSEQIKLFGDKRTIKISGSVGAVIATGSYQNLKPHFSWEETIENFAGSDDEVKDRMQQLYDYGMGMIVEAEQKAIAERIQRERKDLRIMESPSGNMLPSVTSIINYDADFYIDIADLVQYASQGSVTDARVRNFIKTGKWVNGEELPETWVDRQIIIRGSLGLDVNVGNFPAFLEKHPIKDMKAGERFFNDKDGYCGEPDILGEPEFAKPIPTVFDVKRTWTEAYRDKFGMQLSAYCHFYGAKQGIIIPLNGKTKQGFSQPVIYDEAMLAGYFKMFQDKQKEFKKRYNI